MVDINIITIMAGHIFKVLGMFKDLLGRLPFPMELLLILVAFSGAWYLNKKFYKWDWIITGVAFLLLLLVV